MTRTPGGEGRTEARVARAAGAAPGRRAYQPPRLTSYGDGATLTQGRSGNRGEMGGP